MNQIIDHIEYLIARHDCVVIPSFGGFVANYESARIDESTDKLFPPTRIVSFNRNLTHNDGLLAHSIARKDAINYDAAVDIVAAGVRGLNFHLKNDHEVSIGKLGTLTLDKGEIIDFLPSGKAIDYLSALSPIELTPLVKPMPVEIKNEENVLKRPTWIKRAVRAAASIAALVAIGLTVSTTQGVDTSRLTTASLVPSESNEFVLNTPPAIELLIASPSFSESTAITKKKIEPEPADYSKLSLSAAKAYEFAASKSGQSDDTTPTDSSVVPANEPNPATILDPTGNEHYLIVGSFNSMRRAKMYINQKKDNTLGIVKMGKNYRIYAAVASTEEEVVRLKDNPEFSKKYPKAWPTHD
ncbi:MAG: hypothetical protein IK120_01870 [Muribaculaceae bacterium]|nr:hypothetical protein [Muribaculaceae bacterium]